MSKAKQNARLKKTSPAIIEYEMFAAEKYLQVLTAKASSFNYAKNQAVLRQIYKGKGANYLFCGAPVERVWIASFTTHGIDAETRLQNKKPHFISVEIGKVRASIAVIMASKLWLESVKPEMDALNMLATRIDVVLRPKA